MIKAEKKLTKAGGITIPCALRRLIGLKPGMGFEITIDENRKEVVIRGKVACSNDGC